jgi:transcriptional regulator with XRE-family HTH domain
MSIYVSELVAIIATKFYTNINMTGAAPMDFINWLNKEIEKRDWSIRQTARAANLSHTVISNLLSGDKPTFNTCAALAEAFNIPSNFVFQIAGLVEEQKRDELSDEAEFLMSQLSPYQRQLAVKFIRVLAEEKGGYNATGSLVEDEQK